MTNKKTTGVAGAGDNTYAYDQLGRLTSWKVGTKTTDYSWDEASNRTKNGTKLASYDERNRLINDGTSTYTYSARGALLSKTDGTTTEAFTFDAFDRMIRSSDRDFTYDALDRPVQAGTARMRYDGFSDEVVTDGTQSFGRSASDGLLSMGYDTTKRLVMADRHGDIIAGFDPTDTTLSTGLPDTRTYDPFGNSTNATGLKYRVGYQGDWTDPRSGDVNQGARWYNPDSATFNSRDTMTYAGGTAPSLPNLYAYAGGNPLTFNDPSGNYAVDPDQSEQNRACGWLPGRWVVDGPADELYCNPNKKPAHRGGPWRETKKTSSTDNGKGNGTGTGTGTGKGTGKGAGAGTGNGGGVCKTGCRPAPPKCDIECQRHKQAKAERARIDRQAQTVTFVRPGDPSCSNGNPMLCPGKPGAPATVVGTRADTSAGNSDHADDLYQEAAQTLGSTVGNVTEKGSWFDRAAEFGLPGSHLSPGEAELGRWIDTHPELVHLGLDVLGFVPVAGEYFDGVNALLYASQGDYANAALSGSSMIPIAGWIPAGGKLAGKLPKLIGKALKKCETNSFLPDTRVLMADGTTKRIDQIKVGDSVLATNPEDGTTSPQKVTAVIIGDGEKSLVDITVEEKETIGLKRQGTLTATDGHPFFDKNSETWVDAGDLRPGDSLAPAGRTAAVSVTSVRSHHEMAQVFNLTVASAHTYYVLAGETPVLVHNTSCVNLGAGAPKPGNVAVVGRLEDTAAARDWAGHDVLNIPDWTIAKNDAWVNAVIKNKQEVYVASPLTHKNLWDAVNGRQTVLARELKMLTDAGYKWDGYYMRPPGR